MTDFSRRSALLALSILGAAAALGAVETGLSAAEKRVGPSGDLHLKYVAEVAPLFRLRRSRAIQQPGRELHAPGRAGPQELAARGEPTVRTKGGSDSLGR